MAGLACEHELSMGGLIDTTCAMPRLITQVTYMQIACTGCTGSARRLKQRVAAHDVVEEGEQRDGAACVARKAQEQRRPEVAVHALPHGLPARGCRLHAHRLGSGRAPASGRPACGQRGICVSVLLKAVHHL